MLSNTCRLLCWIHHQMRDPKLYCRPSITVSSQRQTVQQASEFHQHGFFFLSTIQPLYEKLRIAAMMEQPTQVGQFYHISVVLFAVHLPCATAEKMVQTVLPVHDACRNDAHGAQRKQVQLRRFE
jgi:hypothetical protein